MVTKKIVYRKTKAPESQNSLIFGGFSIKKGKNWKEAQKERLLTNPLTHV